MAVRLNPVDHPWVINYTLAVVTAVHGALTALGTIPNIWAPFLAIEPNEQAAIYLGFLGGAAIVSGFAGVVVVFGLSGESEKFREFRVVGGRSLVRNWTSTISSSLIAAGLGLSAAIALYSGGAFLGPWLLQIGILLVTHASFRLLFLLRGLIGIVAADDITKTRAARKKPVSEAPFAARRVG